MRPTRSLWLLAVVLACALFLRPQLGIPRATLTHGPLLGGVGDRYIKVWMRSSRRATFRVHYWPRRDRSHSAQTDGVALTAATDFTGVDVLRGLQPLTDYEYQIELSDEDGSERLKASVPQHFRTLPSAGTPCKLRIVAGADLAERGPAGFDQMRALHPDVALLLGDNIYKGRDGSIEALRALYRAAWSGDSTRRFFAQIPTQMIWDDHELRDNYWPGKMDVRPSRQSFDEYQGSHNPDPLHAGDLYFRLPLGDSELFMLDTRSHRSPNHDPDRANKSMLGVTQRAALLDWLATSRARFKLIGSSVPFANTKGGNGDAWNAFSTERTQLVAAMAQHDTRGVVILSGDMHWSGIFREAYDLGAREQSFQLYELLTTPFAAENRRWSYEHNEQLLSHDDRHHVFGVIDLDTLASPSKITLTMCAVGKPCRPGAERSPLDPSWRDHLPYSLVLHESDFGINTVSAPTAPTLP